MEEQKNTKTGIGDKIFGAEENSAAKIGADALDKHREIAIKMFNTPVLTPKEMAFPAIAELASKLFTALGAYRTLYFVSVLRIDMVYVTAILTLIGIYDVLNDPLMGIVYDKTRTRWGKARPYLIFTPIPYFISTAVMYCGALFFTNETTDDPKKILFLFVALFVQETFSTIFNIPRNNMMSLMSPNPKDRITLGIVQGYLGQFGTSIVFAIFMPLQDLNRWGITNVSMPMIFAVLGCFCAGAGIVGNMSMAVGCRERIMLQPKPTPVTKTMFYILKNKYALRNFVASFATSWWSGGGYSWDVVTQLEIFGGAFKSALFYLPFNIVNPISLLFISKYQKFFKYNNRNAKIMLSFWDMLTGIFKWLGGRFFIDKSWIVGSIFAVGYALDAANNAPADVFNAEIDREINDYTEYVTGERPDGTFGLLTNLIKNVTSPLNALMTIAVFKWSGYDPSIPMGPWSQGNKVVYRKVLFLYCAFEVLPRIVGTIPYFFYDLVGEKREKMYIELNERRALIAKEREKEMPDELSAMIDILDENDE